MTVNTTNITSGPYAGNAVSDTFSYTFRVANKGQLSVYETDANGVQTLLTVDSDYTVNDVGEDDGGTIVRLAGPLPFGHEWYIKSNYQENQLTAFSSQGAYFPDLHEDVADKLTFLIQQLRDSHDRTLRLSESLPLDSAFVIAFTASDRANKYLAFDSNGDFVLEENIDASSVVQTDLDQRHAIIFETVAAMKSVSPVDIAGNIVNLTDGLTVRTQGYYAAGDGGKAEYLIAGTQVVDNFGNHDLNNGNVALLQPEIEGNVRQFGMRGNGVTEGSAAFSAVLAASQAVYFPAGDYLIDVVAGQNFVPQANTRIYGDGREVSKLNFRSVVTSYKSIFEHSNNGLIIEGLSCIFSGVVNDSVQFISARADNLQVKDCLVDGENSAVNANLFNFIEYVDDNTDNLKILNCELRNMQRVQLRSNARTGAITNVLYQDNYIHDLGQGGVQFNTPLGSSKHIRILGNHFEDFHAGTEQIFCGGASVSDIVIDSNVFAGSANECVHLEEGVENATISNNVMVADADGVFITDNNVGGPSENPQQVIIANNNMFDGSLTRANQGIRGVADGVGIESFESISITGNTIRGYERGIALGFGPKVVQGNTIINCDFGMRIDHATPTVTENMLINCATGVYAVSQSGLFGVNSFKDCTTVAESQFGEKVSMAGFMVYVDTDTSLPTTVTTNVNLGIEIGSEFWGHATAQVYVSNTKYQHRISQLEYDGTTLTDTERQRAGSGNVSFSGFVNNGGQLAIALNNAGPTINLQRISVRFEGMYTSAT